MLLLKDKVILVTGSSRGIGKAIALCCAKMGAIVIINCSHSESEAISTANKIREMGSFGIFIKSNISKENEVSKLRDRIKEKFGRLDVLVNNAGILKKETLSNQIGIIGIKSFR